MKTLLKEEESSYYPTWFIGLAGGCLVYVLLTAVALYRIHQSFTQAQFEGAQALALTLRKGFGYQKMLGNPELRLRYYGFREGASVDTAGEDGKTPLMLAALAGDSAAIRSLLRKGAKPFKQDTGGQTALHFALRQNSLEAVKLLVHASNINVPDNYRMTPLLRALREGKAGYALYLLERGALATDCNADGMAAMHFAAALGESAILLRLQQKGADVNPINKVGSSPLHVAAKEGKVEAVKWLINAGASVNLQNRYGMAPLHYAVAYGHVDVAKVLLEKGASAWLKDKNGQSPLSIAQKKKQTETLNWMKQK
jgi:ankyrin repeat protein